MTNSFYIKANTCTGCPKTYVIPTIFLVLLFQFDSYLTFQKNKIPLHWGRWNTY